MRAQAHQAPQTDPPQTDPPLICVSYRTALCYMLRMPNERHKSTGRRSSRIARVGAGAKAAGAAGAASAPTPAAPSLTPAVPASAPSKKDAAALLTALSHSLPEGHSSLDIIVSTQAGRSNTKVITSHLCTTELPESSFIPTEARGIPFCLCAPELVFLQMAEELDFELLVYVGYALCSAFRLERLEPGGCCHRADWDSPLTSRSRIAAYLDLLPAGTRNVDVARRALEHVRDNARSPMEAGVAMLLGMPARYGGYALGEVELNREIKVYDGVDKRGNPAWKVRIPDVLVRATDKTGAVRQVGVDYDADATHRDPVRMWQDVERRNLLAARDDLIHFTLGTWDTRDFENFDQAANRIRRALRQRPKPRVAANPESEKDRDLARKTYYRRYDLWEKVLSKERYQL